MNSIHDIKRSVGSIDTKMTEIKREKVTLSRRMTAVESSQSFISKTYDENIRMNKEVNN
jgi:hypothetical protein